MKGINLVTGAIGSGKSCYIISLMQEAIAEGRPVFAHGFRQLKLPHEPVYCSSPMCIYCRDEKPKEGDFLLADQWHIWAPQSALVVFDEVQHIFRPRGQGAKVPDCVAAFEMSRHVAVDFILACPDPMLFDSNVRKLVTSHENISGNWGGQLIYQWVGCQTDTKITSKAVKRNYEPNKKNFDLYLSADKHTKKRALKKPLLFYILPVLVLALIFLTYRVVVRVSDMATATPEVLSAAVESGTGAGLPDTGTDRQQADYVPDVPRSFSDYSPSLVGYSRFGSRVQIVVRWSREGWSDIVTGTQELAAAGYQFSPIARFRVVLISGLWSQVVSLAPYSVPIDDSATGDLVAGAM